MAGTDFLEGLRSVPPEKEIGLNFVRDIMIPKTRAETMRSETGNRRTSGSETTPKILFQVSFFATFQPSLKSRRAGRVGSASQSSSRIGLGVVCPPREKEKAWRMSRWDIWWW